MTHRITHRARSQSQAGFTLPEMLMAVGVGSIVLAMVTGLFLFGLRSFAAMSNYAELSGKSRQSLDLLLRDIRQATNVLSFNTNLPIKSLTLGTYDGTVTYAWDSNAGVLTTTKAYPSGATIVQTNLIGCEQWNFFLYQRTPTNGYVFFPTTDLKICKLIEMSWKCSRSMLGKKVNSEEIMTAQVVIRNMNVVISN